MTKNIEMLIYEGGYKEWRLNGRLHREDGPAVIWPSGTLEWYQNGKRHRVDGPAIVWASGSEDEYWLRGKQVTKKEIFDPNLFVCI